MRFFRKIYRFIKTFTLIVSIIDSKGDNLAPILITPNNEVIDGHTRVRIAKHFGMKVPIVRTCNNIEYVDASELKEMY